MARLKSGGVFFANSHAVYPTFTTPNASALATGHQLGDTGDFANALFPGFAVNGTETPFIEDDRALAALDARLDGNFLGEETLLAAARAQGFSTAALGKVGPTLIQDLTQGNGGGPPSTIVIDDSTGSVEGVALDPAIAAKLKPPRPPAKSAPNLAQQKFLTDALVDVILPEFKRRGRPVRGRLLVARPRRHASTPRTTARPTGTSASTARRRSAPSGTRTTRWGGSWRRSRPTPR